MSTNAKPATRRINRGSGHSYELDGHKVPSVTGILREGFPKDLTKWAGDSSGAYVVDHWDELVELAPSERRKLVADARFSIRREASMRGKVIHAYAQRLAAGETVEVPDQYRDPVDTYLRFADEWIVDELMVESPVFSRRHRYAGTPDLVAKLVDGNTWLLDWKTGGKGVYLEHVLQLAACRYADFALDDDGGEQPVPEVDATGLVWLRADGYDLYPVEADEQAFEAFLAAKSISEYLAAGRSAWIGDSMLPEEMVLW